MHIKPYKKENRFIKNNAFYATVYYTIQFIFLQIKRENSLCNDFTLLYPKYLVFSHFIGQ